MTIFRGELQLLRWGETSTGGATVTFQLADVGDLDGFKDLTLAKKGMAGQRIAAIMVQVEDDIEQPAPVVQKVQPGMLCIMACNFSADVKFQEWANSLSGTRVEDEEDAKCFILNECGIESRKELDIDQAAAKRFHKLIREPYMASRAARSI